MIHNHAGKYTGASNTACDILDSLLSLKDHHNKSFKGGPFPNTLNLYHSPGSCTVLFRLRLNCLEEMGIKIVYLASLTIKNIFLDLTTVCHLLIQLKLHILHFHQYV